MDIKKHILKKFMYNGSLRYNEIWDKVVASNKFNYYLQQLVDEDIIKKQNEVYQLTSKGTHLISSLDGVKIEEKKNPIVCSFVMAVNDEGQILMNMRKKQPFINTLGIPGGKIDLGKTPLEQAKEELKEETGLDANYFSLRLVTNYITYNEGNDSDVIHQVIAFYFLAKKLSGTLINTHREGENIFMDISEIKKYKRYPDIDTTTELMLQDVDHVICKNAKRWMKDNEFTKIQFSD